MAQTTPLKMNTSPHIPVAISGMGCVSASGIGVEHLADALFTNKTGFRKLRGDRMDKLRIQSAAMVDREALSAAIEASAPDEKPMMDPFAQCAVLAADEALEGAGLTPEDIAGAETAVIVGSGFGGSCTFDDGTWALYGEQKRRLHPLTIPRAMLNGAASNISLRYGTTGMSLATCSACASSAHAIGTGVSLIRSGVARRVIVGGAETMVGFAVMSAWEGMRVMTNDLCRPFSRDRSGMAVGEGAAIFVLEREEDVEARGHRPLARFIGYGTSSDGNHMLRPNPSSLAAAMTMALNDAGIEPRDLAYVNAHGTATIANDIAESEAMAIAFGDDVGRSVPVSSTKPIHGHAMGASGGIEMVATILAMQHGKLPANANWLGPDEKCPINVISATKEADIPVAMSNSFAFGGSNVSLIIARD